MGNVFLFALAAALNPTLVAASTLMMLLPQPVQLMLGYLLGALMTSITLGLVIVFSLESSDAVTTTENTLSPAATMALGVSALVAAFVLGTGRHQRAAERRRARKEGKHDKGPPRWQRALGKGSARVTFVVGALLTLPGAAYLAGLSRIDKLNDAHGAWRTAGDQGPGRTAGLTPVEAGVTPTRMRPASPPPHSAPTPTRGTT